MARSRSVSRSRSPRRRHESSRSHHSRRRRSRSRSRSHESTRHRERRRSRDDSPAPPPTSESASAPKVTEENGEISMSIEETNKLRVSLGLKPLSTGPKKEKNVVNLQKTSEQLAVENQRAEMKKALEQSRKKRELTQKLAGKSIGEQLRETTAASALDWVKQSRITAQDAAKTSTKPAKKAEKDVYDASALAGMTVAHDAAAFEEGDEVVLTLKDSRVLQADGKDINDEEDELVNVEISEKERRDRRQKQALRAKMPVYSGLDDDEFIELGGAKKKMKKKTTQLLAQYDEDDEMKQEEDLGKFTLDASGASFSAVSSKREADRGRGYDDDGDVAVVSLAMDKSKAIEDFYTADELAAQFSKKSKKLRKKKNKKLRTKTADDGEDGEEEADAAALVQQLEAQAKAESRSDRGRRRRPVHDDDEEDTEELANLRRFQEARDKASAVASSALAASGADDVGKKKLKKRRVDMDEDGVDMELSATLARARQLKQQQELATVVTIKAEDKIAALVSSTEADGDEKMSDASVKGNVFGSMEIEAKHAVVFNDATDFETRLRSAMEQRSAQFEAATASASKRVAVENQHEDNGGRDDDAMEVDSDAETKQETKEEEEEEDGEGREAGWADDQPLVGAGMGATLALLRRTGELRDTSRVERQAGRANDARDRDVKARDVKEGVTLDYRDEFGRLLTKKEAFRLLSYKFHGHKPGKKKQEKRLKQLKEELAAQKLLSGEGSSKMMKTLDSKQGQAKQAYVVLSSGT